MKTIDLHQVDAFTDKVFGGNPAGVVTNADGLTDDEMKNIAREMNLSETAFVLKPTSNTAEIKLRYFTPEAEIKFCGHATVGALYELSRLNMYGLNGEGVNTVRVETNAGILEMSVIRDDSNEPRVRFTAPGVEMSDFRLQGEAFAREFNIAVSTLRPDSKILIDRNLNYVYIPVASLDELSKLKFDFTNIRSRFADDEIVVFCLFTNEAFGKDSDLHARGLAPLVGVDEDPFTGSMQSGLIHTAKQNGMINSKQSQVITEQGNFIGRPGFATIDHDITTDTLLVTARAAHVFSTTMEF